MSAVSDVANLNKNVFKKQGHWEPNSENRFGTLFSRKMYRFV